MKQLLGIAATAHSGDNNVLTEIAFKDLTLVFAGSAQ